MAPEQCFGVGPIQPQTDIYAIGVTLFEMLAGRPPFLGKDTAKLINQHMREPPPQFAQIRPDVSDAVSQIVEKALAKSAADRYLNAQAMLGDLERVLRGEPTRFAAHPQLPTSDPRRTLRFDFSWELEASAELLWRHVSNTDRLNQVAGLRPIEFTSELDVNQDVQNFRKIELAGLEVEWEEHPFEWIEGQRLSVLREFTRGPFKWFVNVVQLRSNGAGGTTLTHSVQVEPRGILGRSVAAVELGVKARRSLARIYHRIDAAVCGRFTQGTEAFAKPARLSGVRRQRLERLLDRLVSLGADADVAERLGDFVAHGSAQELARIRPLSWAKRYGMDPDEVVTACMYDAREGLLVLMWDILCPICRISSDVLATLRALRDHAHCRACNLEFELDFADSIEMIFRASPEIRDVDLGTYCIGGPAHSPHVVVQVRVAAKERFELDLALRDRAYRLRSPQLSYSFDFEVRPQGRTHCWELGLGESATGWGPHLKSGRQRLVLTNDHRQELLIRIERRVPPQDVLTAALASSLAVFRELFPEEVLSRGQLINVTTVTLLVIDLHKSQNLYQELGDSEAFTRIHTYFQLVGDKV